MEIDRKTELERHFRTYERNRWTHGPDCMCKNADRYFQPSQPEPEKPDVRRLLSVETPDINGEGITTREMKHIIED